MPVGYYSVAECKVGERPGECWLQLLPLKNKLHIFTHFLWVPYNPPTIIPFCVPYPVCVLLI